MEGYDLYERREPSLSGWERELYDSVSREQPWELVEAFASLRRHGGTADEAEAAHYLVDRFETYGIECDLYEPELWVSHPDDASLRAVSPVQEELDLGGDRPAIKPMTWGASDTVRGEVISLEVPEVSVEEFRNVTIDDMTGDDQDLEGSIVVIGEQILSLRVSRAVEERGAAAYVNVHPHEREPHQFDATPIWGGIPTPDQADLLPEIPMATAASPIGDRIRELADEHGSLELELSTSAPREWTTCPVVVARVPAEAAATDDFVLLHGHYDAIEFGVTDNATGNAGMVEIARILDDHRDQLQRDLWVAFWPAHERRYVGSAWFVDEFATELMERCVAHVNFDSPGAKDATEYEEFVTWSPEADNLCRAAIDDVAGKDSVENRTRRSGDYGFYNIGISGMLALCSSIPEDVRQARGIHTVSGSGGNSNAWHLSTDTLDNADPDVLVRDIRIYLTIMARLLGSDVLPLDYRRTLDFGREIIDEYDAVAGEHFDLGPVRNELEALDDTVRTFYDAIAADEIDPTTANATMKRLQRGLIPMDYVQGAHFDQDLAVQRPPYPDLQPAAELSDLDGDEYRFHKRALTRARNAVEYELRETRRAVEGAHRTE